MQDARAWLHPLDCTSTAGPLDPWCGAQHGASPPPPRYTKYQQSQRWLKAGVAEAAAHDLLALLTLSSGRKQHPSALILDTRTLQSSPESGGRAWYNRAWRKLASRSHVVVDTLEHLLTLHVTIADSRTKLRSSSEQIWEVTGQSVKLLFVDQGRTGNQPAPDAAA